MTRIAQSAVPAGQGLEQINQIWATDPDAQVVAIVRLVRKASHVDRQGNTRYDALVTQVTPITDDECRTGVLALEAETTEIQTGNVPLFP